MSHRFIIRVFKLIFVVSSLSFLLIQINMRRSANSAQNDVKNEPQLFRRPKETDDGPSSDAEPEPKKVDPATTEQVSSLPIPKLEDIRRSIEFNNAHTEILNEKKFGPVSAVSTVIVVQVHNRAKYLEMLVRSLKNARGIEKTLLIFSHDFYSNEINKIVHDIDFTMVMQIFYPFSIQVFPDKFPGHDPLDCPPDIGKSKAQDAKCQNWQYPDKYGHYRVAKFTQIKHHWWWKMNYVLDGIPQIRSFGGYVLLLEEDHIVSPDFLHVLDFTIENKESLCKECTIITLGFYLKSYGAYGANIDKLAVYPWFSSRHNMGMALNKQTWEKLKNCSHLFCTFDDYNWDWSLMRVNMQCLKERLQVLFTKAPRVFHIGDCGVHHKCQADTSAKKVADILAGVNARLFPVTLSVSERSKRMLKPPKENGGWGDVRDHHLCLNNTRWSTNQSSDLSSPFIR